jgi:osmotically inducible protein OsmC
MAAERRAQTTWEGDLASGSGTFTVGSGSIGPQEVSWTART